jgi:N-acyl-D-amino-acid deacylase
LTGKGFLKPGMDGDIVIFDPDAIQDTSTYEEPEQLAKGIRMVLLDGTPVAENDCIIQRGQGKVLLRIKK